MLGFARYLRTIPENMNEPTFTPYEQWAKTWQLNETELRDWKSPLLAVSLITKAPTLCNGAIKKS